MINAIFDYIIVSYILSAIAIILTILANNTLYEIDFKEFLLFPIMIWLNMYGKIIKHK